LSRGEGWKIKGGDRMNQRNHNRSPSHTIGISARWVGDLLGDINLALRENAETTREEISQIIDRHLEHLEQELQERVILSVLIKQASGGEDKVAILKKAERFGIKKVSKDEALQIATSETG